MAAVTLLAFFLGMEVHGTQGDGLKRASTMTFMTLALVQVVHVFSSRSETRSAFGSQLFNNGWLWGAVVLCVLLQVATVYVPLLSDVLQTVPLGAKDWGGIVVGCAVFPLAVIEVAKLIQRRSGARGRGGAPDREQRSRTHLRAPRIRQVSRFGRSR